MEPQHFTQDTFPTDIFPNKPMNWPTSYVGLGSVFWERKQSFIDFCLNFLSRNQCLQLYNNNLRLIIDMHFKETISTLLLIQALVLLF